MPHRPLPHRSTIVGACIFCALFFFSTPLYAEGDPQTVDWLSVAEVAAEVYEKNIALGATHQVDGLNAAAAAVPGRWQSVDVGYGGELGFPGGAFGSGEHALNAGINVLLGDLPAAQRRAYEARRGVAEAASDQARFAFVLQAQSYYIAWWTEATLAEHLEEHLAEVEKKLEPIVDAANNNSITRLDLEDLRVESARLEMEAATARHNAANAAAQLQGLLTIPFVLSDQGMLDLEVGALPNDNPWDDLEDALAQHPSLRGYEARKNVAQAQIDVAEESAPWTLSGGVTLRLDEGQLGWYGAGVSLNIPLQNTALPTIEIARATIDVAQLEADWRAQTLSAQIRAAATRYDAAAERLEVLSRRWLAPLIERQKNLEAALKLGQVDRFRVIRGWRELHESEHERLLIIAELIGQRSHAEALRRALEPR